MTGITINLFELIGLNIEDWYMLNVGLAGVVRAPLVAGFLFDVVLQRKSYFANLIANIFAPLFLLTVLTYLIAMLVAQRSPYEGTD